MRAGVLKKLFKENYFTKKKQKKKAKVGCFLSELEIIEIDSNFVFQSVQNMHDFI